MGFDSGVLKLCPAAVRKSVGAWQCLGALWAIWLAVTPHAVAQSTIELTLVADSSAVGRSSLSGQPMRVILVVDGSASMNAFDRGGDRWTLVGREIRADIANLSGAGTPSEVTVVKFAWDPSDVARPGPEGWTGTLADRGDAQRVADDVIFRLGNADGGGTALFRSMINAIEALERDLASGRYSGGQIIIYSDGKDSTAGSSYQTQRSQAIGAVRALRARHPMSNVGIRTFGKEAEEVARELPEVLDLTGERLKVPPRLVRLSLTPPVAQMDALRAPRTQRIRVDSSSVPADLRQAIGVEFEVSGDTIPATLEGESWVGEIVLPQEERGLDVRVVARATGVPDAVAVIRAPALRLPASPDQWGLPRCGAGWGVMVSVGDPVQLSVRVPDGVTVLWTEEGGGWSARGSSAIHPGFADAGERRMRVQVQAQDGSKEQVLTVFVVPAEISIAGPRAVNVGEAATFKSPMPPGSAQARWFIDGQPAGTGQELKTAFAQRGNARVVVESTVSRCGQDLVVRGSAVVSVAPVPSVELGDVDLVRGAGELNRIPVRIMVASRVRAVRVTFPGGQEVRTSLSSVSAGDDASIEVGVPDTAVDGPGRLRVRVQPEVVSDSGGIDAEASERAMATRDYEIRNPRTNLMIEDPPVGHEALFEVPMPIRVRVDGSMADRGAARAVRLTYSDGRTEDAPIGKDGTASAAFTPRFTSGGRRVSIRAVALDSAGAEISDPQVRDVALRNPGLKLRPSVDQVHRDTADPADLTITLESPDGAVGWEDGIALTSWRIDPAGGAEVASESRTKLVLRVTGVEAVSVSATVTRGGGQELVGPVEIPVVIDGLEPQFRVAEVDGSAQVGTVIGERVLKVVDRTRGPVASRRFFMLREGGQWEQISPDSFTFRAATRRGERVQVRAEYVALDGAKVDGGTLEFSASPDHNWPLVAVVIVVCIGLTIGAWWLCHNNEFLGAVASWSADDLGTTLRFKSHIHWIRGTARCSVVTKRARIPLPPMYGEGQFDWLDELRRRRVFLEMGGNLPRAQLSGGSGVAVTGGSRDGRIRKTTLQPMDSGCDPVYLTISPSPTAAFVGWMSLTAAATTIWSAFLFIFLRGYI